MPLFGRRSKHSVDAHHPHPSQMMVLYNGFPALDTVRLADDIIALEPAGPPVEVPAFRSAADDEGRRTTSGTLTIGQMPLTVEVHNWPLDREVMRYSGGASNLNEAAKGPLRTHRAYALVSVAGEARPIEKMACLLKVTAGLVAQGAVGAANHETWSAFVPEIFGLLDEPGFWQDLRAKGIPAVLTTGFVKVNVSTDELWFITRGHRLYGLPELAYRAQGHQEAEGIFDVFTNIFHYMFDTGTVLHVGDTMEMDERTGQVMRFQAPPAEAAFLESPTGTLVTEFKN
ncbi:MAG: hypothetical protein ACFB51_11485 [Anaerolineae bacterium]